MRKTFIAGNWKMNKTVDESVELAKAVVAALKDGKFKYMIAPSFTALYEVGKVLKGSNVRCSEYGCARFGRIYR